MDAIAPIDFDSFLMIFIEKMSFTIIILQTLRFMQGLKFSKEAIEIYKTVSTFMSVHPFVLFWRTFTLLNFAACSCIIKVTDKSCLARFEDENYAFGVVLRPLGPFSNENQAKYIKLTSCVLLLSSCVRYHT